MSKRVFNTILDILLRPFTKHFHFFIVFSLLLASCHVYIHFISSDNTNISIAMLLHCLSFSYIATLLVSLIKSKIYRHIAQLIMMLFVASVFSLNYYCLSIYRTLFDVDFAHLILETDPNEATEFLTTMLPMSVVLPIVGIFLLLAIFWWLSKRRGWNLNLGRKFALCALGATCLCFAVNIYVDIHLWNMWETGPWTPYIKVFDYKMPADLKSYFSHPDLTYEEDSHRPANVVVIIGESFSRSHSSLYGYEKLTNPELTALKNDSLLFAFDSINSPAHSTSKSISDMLSIFNLSDSVYDREWYEYPSIIEIMKECGYYSYWFGNQAITSVYGASARIYALTCDRHFFLRKTISDDNDEESYDIVLVDSAYQYANQSKLINNNFFLFHMYGSHFDYSKRYPQEFAKFSTNDYLSEPESHRGILSSYDNSILYNDYVVKRIIDLFMDSEAIVIYLPDHGQVMYRYKNRPDYYAHGLPPDTAFYALGVDIPFFIYASPLFQRHFPETMERIRERQDHPKAWNTGDLPYLIMDLIGVKKINGESVQTKSVLN